MSIIKKLDASRRIQSDLALEKHHQELQKSKLERELGQLSKSRRDYINNQISYSAQEYEEKLKANLDVGEEHVGRQKRAAAERARIAQQDFERERERLLKERNLHDQVDKQSRVLDKEILNLKARSKIANENEERAIADLIIRKQTILKLLGESRQRELFHYEQSKKLSQL